MSMCPYFRIRGKRNFLAEVEVDIYRLSATQRSARSVCCNFAREGSCILWDYINISLCCCCSKNSKQRKHWTLLVFFGQEISYRTKWEVSWCNSIQRPVMESSHITAICTKANQKFGFIKRKVQRRAARWITNKHDRTTSVSSLLQPGASITMGQGGHVPPNIWTGGTWSRMSPPQYF